MQTIGTGRYLCKLYYRGELKPSAFYKINSPEWALARCVEKPLERTGKIANYWRLLMSGELKRLPVRTRSKLNNTVAGGRANFTGVQWRGIPIESCVSLDGNRDGELTIGEIMLYEAVGSEFLSLIK